MSEVHADKTPQDLPLFQAMCGDIASDLSRMNVELPGLKSLEQEVFDYICARGLHVREHRRITMCRFAASIAGGEFHIPKWNIDKYQTLTLCLQCDCLKGRK